MTVAPGETAARPITRWRQATPIWAGRILQAAGVWSVVAYVFRPLFPRASFIVANLFELINLPGQPNLFNGVLLLMVGAALRHRKRVGMWGVILWFEIWAPLSFIVNGLVSLVTDNNVWDSLAEDLQQAVSHRAIPAVRASWSGRSLMWWDLAVGLTAVATMIVLLLARHAFSARMEKGAWWRALAILGAGISVSTAAGFLLTIAWPGHLTSIWQRLVWSAGTAVGLGPRDLTFNSVPLRGPGEITFLITMISAVSLFAAIAEFMRSASVGRLPTPADELAVRQLLLECGDNDSLGYFATRRDKSVTFSPNGRAAIAYRVINSTVLASGDPIGHRDSWQSAIERWRDEARSYGWAPAVVAVTTEGARAYEAAGFRSLSMGDEAVVLIDDFSLAGPAMRAVRAEVSRAERAGYHALVRQQRDIPTMELAELGRAAQTWRLGEVERGFSMASGRLGDPTDGSNVVVVAYDDAGQPRGLLSFVPWGRGGLSLDLMRRHPQAAGGVTELMITTLLNAAPDLRIRRISLNFAMFRRTFEQGAQIGATPSQRFFRKALLVASRWWQLESLYRSNEKYHPQWQQRLLCYERGSSLTQVLIATGQAEGFLPAPQRFFFRRGSAEAPSRERDAAFVEQVQRQEVAADLRPVATRRLSAQERDRRGHLARLRDAGIDPYPVAVDRTVDIGELRRHVSEGTTPDDGSTAASVVGRIVRARHHGGLVFLDLREGTAHIQAMMRLDHCREPAARPHRLLDLGDIIAVTGEVMRTRTGELTIDVTRWAMAAKSLIPMPDKRLGLIDPEAKLRLRHVDLALNGHAQAMMRARSTTVRALRESLHRRGFIEVETPMLQLVHGGANARPFRTHINAYDADLYLRIAPELALKRLAVGGLQRVFEVGRNFRNEGADASHNPEFTSVEVYQAFADYTTMRHLTQALIVEAATAVHGIAVARRGDETIDLDGTWPAITVHAAVSAAIGRRITPDTPMADIRTIAAEQGVPSAGTSGEIVTELYDRLVEPNTTLPTFYLDFPVETSPLTRPHRDDPRLAERWDLVAFGMELGTAYSELTDPIEQRERLTRQSLRAAAGDPEAMELDEDFLAALEFGLPPTGGLGLGVDRIVMALTGAPIRQTLAFPFLRPTGR